MKKKTLEGLKSPTVHAGRARRRDCRRLFRAENAKQSIGRLKAGCEIFGFTKGQYSLIDALQHVLEQVGGSADVDVATWSAASGDIRAAHRLCHIGTIRRLRFLVDFSFPRRKPAFCAELVEAFGADCIRITSIHAKFMTVRAGDWRLVIRTSMNLNFNPRFENFEISDDPALFAFVEAIVDEIWNSQAVGEGLENSPYQNKKQFGAVGTADGPLLDAVEAADLEVIKL